MASGNVFGLLIAFRIRIAYNAQTVSRNEALQEVVPFDTKDNPVILDRKVVGPAFMRCTWTIDKMVRQN